MTDTLLDTITSPHQLQRLEPEQLTRLAEEIRQRITDVVQRNGGHLASNLGITDLTLALHYVFDFASDRLLWDVGHQCYAHKILTGRGGQFDSLRQAGGLSGFPSPAESQYDLFSTGHAGTAISTAAGLAMGDFLAGRDTKVAAVVGDASIVNGLALEGLNNAALLKRQFLVILNDNSMAIDRTRGALAEALEHIRMTNTYGEIKKSTERMLDHMPLGESLNKTLRQVRGVLRTTVHGAKVFEPLGFSYFGPVNGHDVETMISVLERLAHYDRPAVLHVHTQKGRGLAYAVEDPCRFHSPSAHRVHQGQAVFDESHRPSWTNTFADALIECARQDEKVLAITAAMPDGTGLARFREVFPERTIDVGISESHAVASAAGLAKAGFKPVVAIYSTFMQRAYDQVFHECALQKLPVVFCMDRAGLVGSDGAVHHGAMDTAMLRAIPGIMLCAPADEAEMTAAMQFALAQDVPVALRYPRDEVPDNLPGPCEPFQAGRSRTLRDGADATILAYGAMCEQALAAAESLAEKGVDVAVINARFAKPLDEAMLAERLAAGRPMLVAEDHSIIGGLGSAVLEFAASAGLDSSAVALAGIPDRFVAHASRQHQLRLVGLDAERLATRLGEMVHAAG
jgi:1-deoxy-D-xylulose-5-phosphate synthase